MRVWKNFRTNMMYWRFRYVTRNRIRLRQWWNRRRSSARVVPGYSPYRGGVSAMPLYRSTRQRSWIALGALVILLTVLTVGVQQTTVNPVLVYVIGTAIVVGCLYWALRGM